MLLWQVSALPARGVYANFLVHLDGLDCLPAHSRAVRGAPPETRLRLCAALHPCGDARTTQLEPHAPHAEQVLEVVQAITHCLDLSSEVLVVAIVCVEEVLRKEPSYLRVYTLRPTLIVACLIAVKLTDDFVSTRRCWEKLRKAFDDLHFERLLLAEQRMALAIDHRLPIGTIYQRYADGLYELANEWSGETRTAPQVLADEFWS